MVLRVDNLTKRFGATTACDHVSFSVQGGEVVALLGENGAGKSTLLSALAGFVTPDSGAVHVGDAALRFGEPSHALALGIGTAFQHFSLVPTLSVGESFALARLPVAEAMHLLPAHIESDSRISDLAIPARQQVEFTKARMLASRVLLLDEPTSLLGDEDVDRVIGQVQGVARSGVGCIFVTHRLHEALSVADRILVMRRGQLVATLARAPAGWETDVEAILLRVMFGEDDSALRDVPESRESSGVNRQAGEVQVTGDLNGKNVALSVPRGRVLAVAGVAGNGQHGLTELLTGRTASRLVVSTPESGAEDMGHAAMRNWFRSNVTVVPEDRVHEGGAATMSLGENLVARDLVAGRIGRSGLVSTQTLRDRSTSLIARWQVQPGQADVPFGALSGGNMQRAVLGRALDPPPTMLVAVRPTHGLDHRSIAKVRTQLRKAADAGVAVISIEQELDDAIQFADLIAVMYRGELSRLLPAQQAERNDLQRMMVSGWER